MVVNCIYLHPDELDWELKIRGTGRYGHQKILPLTN